MKTEIGHERRMLGDEKNAMERKQKDEEKEFMI